MSSSFWFCAVVTLISAFTSLGFSIAALKTKGEMHTAALYTFARSSALAIISTIAIASGSHSYLLAVATGMTIVQAMDGYIGLKQHDVMKTAGPIFLSLLNLIALVFLARS